MPASAKQKPQQAGPAWILQHGQAAFMQGDLAFSRTSSRLDFLDARLQG